MASASIEDLRDLHAPPLEVSTSMSLRCHGRPPGYRKNGFRTSPRCHHCGNRDKIRPGPRRCLMKSDPQSARTILTVPEQGPHPDSEEMAALRAIVEGTAHGTGEAFFHSLVRQLASAIKVSHAF